MGQIKPLHIQLIPTNRCNANCPWCSCKDVDRKLELPTDECIEILRYFALQGAEAVTITGGGEPTIHPGFLDIIHRCKKSGYDIGLVTNGIEIAKHKIIDVAIKWMRVSITDTCGDYPIDRLTNVLQNMKETDIGISFTVCKNTNLNLAKEISDIANNTSNITHVRFVQDILDPIDAEMDMVKKMCASGTKNIYQYRSEYTVGAKRCLISKLKPVINADGYIYPCCGVQYAKSDSLRTMPDEFRMCHWSDFHKKIDFDGSVCEKCYYNDYNNILDLLTTKVEHGRFV